MSRHDRQVSLASSYYPVLIDRTTIPTDSHAQAQAQAQGQPTVTALTSRPNPTGPRLRRPFPLALLGLADIVYTVRTWLIQPSERVPSIHLLVLSLVRALVLIGALGMSTRWRARGGWIGSLSIVTLGCVVWEGCKGQLVPRRTINGGLEGSKVDTTFLIVVCPPYYPMSPETSTDAVVQTAVFAILEFVGTISSQSLLLSDKASNPVGSQHSSFCFDADLRSCHSCSSSDSHLPRIDKTHSVSDYQTLPFNRPHRSTTRKDRRTSLLRRGGDIEICPMNIDTRSVSLPRLIMSPPSE
jgi:hypothetical protein